MKTNPAAYYDGFTYSKNLSDKEIDELKNQAIKAYENI